MVYMESSGYVVIGEVESQVCGTEIDENLSALAPYVEPLLCGNGMEEGFPEKDTILFDGVSNIEPCEGLEFETEEAAYTFYSEYARCLGFFIRKKSTRYSRRDKTLIATQYVCSKEGFKRSTESVKNPRTNIREGCNAMVRVKKTDTGKWVVHAVEKDHNHALAGPINVHYLRSVRKKLETGPHICEADIVEISVVNEPVALEEIKVEPCVGMEFESEEVSFLFYKEYARRVGFGIRKRSTRYSKRSRTLIATQYVCSKEGFKQINQMVKHPRPNTREGCKAMVKAKRIESGKWIIHFVEKEHSHELVSPANLPIAHSYRKVQTIANKHRGNISHISRSQSNMKDVDISEQDDMNDLDETQGMTLGRGDAKAIIDYFKHKQVQNPSFFYAVEIDEDECLKNIFWADAKSRVACNHFGDVVTFDTTYVTNKCHVPFAPFVGINHHGQPMLFGCAILADRTISSFVWVFETWLAAMSGRQPKSMLTEQDRALKAAVTKVFPKTHLCFSMWHIQTEVLDKLSHSCKSMGNFKEEFEKCVYETETADEFESRWFSLLDTFDLKDNEWLQIFYEDRQQWVPVYMNGTFLAGLSTTKLNESIGSVFDGFVSTKTTMKEFIEDYDTALQYQYEKELCADLETDQNEPYFMTASPLEKQAAGVYTGEMFKKFQIEICQTLGLYATKTKEEANIVVYMAGKFGEEKNYTVTLSLPETRVYCSCRMFEFTGILCRHALRIFIEASIFTIPPPYILKRWTKDPRDRLVLDEVPTGACGSENMIGRYNDLCRKSLKIAEEGALSIDSYHIALESLQDALKKVVAANDSMERPVPSDSLDSNQQPKLSEGSQEDILTDVSEGFQPSKKIKLECRKSPENQKTTSCDNCKVGHNICTCKEPMQSMYKWADILPF